MFTLLLWRVTGSLAARVALTLIFWHTKNMSSITVSQKRRGRPATGETPRVGVRLPADMRAAIDTYIADNPAASLNVSDAIRHLLIGALQSKGYLPPEDEG